MRDGVQLSANIFRPAFNGRWPALLARTPYGKGTALSLNYRSYVDHGYVVVVQDVRGRGESDGVFRPLHQETLDGEDTLNWIGRQAWCTGKIGMIGGSYLGIAQWQAALGNSPYLKAIAPSVAGFDDYFDRFYSRGGAMKLGHRLVWLSENLRVPGYPRLDISRYMWHLPLRTSDRSAAGRTIDFYQNSLNHPSYDAFWRSVSTREQLARVHVPVFTSAGWFDNYAQSDLEAFEVLRRLGRHAYIVVGPWPHSFTDHLPVSFGPQSVARLRTLQFEWFDHWLKGQGSLSDWPAARIFTMGDNEWRHEESWPPAEARIHELFLGGAGKANSFLGDGVLVTHHEHRHESDHYLYDPRKPVPTRGGAICCNPRLLPPGPMDQRPVEQRRDVLVYTSVPLDSDLDVTGNVRVTLWVSTTARDTDFTAKLVDLAPGGSALGVTDGILRLRYRGGLGRPALATPGQIYPIAIDAGVTSTVFRAGHRIRLEISSSNFPRFDRNPNTGRAIAEETELRTASQTVYHGGAYPSALILPVIPRTGTSALLRHGSGLELRHRVP